MIKGKLLAGGPPHPDSGVTSEQLIEAWKELADVTLEDINREPNPSLRMFYKIILNSL